MLEAAQLHCERDDRTLFTDLSFTLLPGETLHVKGQNGAGKTTLLRILVGFFQAHTGTVRWCSQAITQCYAEFRLACCYLSGHYPGLKRALTPLENLHWRSQLAGQYPHPTLLTDALTRVDLSDAAHRPCSQLSTGQQQRVALASLWLNQAPLWLLDEPLTALDQAGTHYLATLLTHHAQQGGMAVIVSHAALPPLDTGLTSLELADYCSDGYHQQTRYA